MITFSKSKSQNRTLTTNQIFYISYNTKFSSEHLRFRWFGVLVLLLIYNIDHCKKLLQFVYECSHNITRKENIMLKLFLLLHGENVVWYKPDKKRILGMQRWQWITSAPYPMVTVSIASTEDPFESLVRVDNSIYCLCT